MEKPQRLKEETERLVSNSEQGNATHALKTVETATDGEAAGAEAPNVAPTQIIRDSAVERERKKLADQEFLVAYKKHELFLRVRFGIIILLVLGCFVVSIPKFFDSIDTEKRVIAHVAPAVSAALLGEKDAAYYQTSQLPIPGGTDGRSGLIENRKRILDQTIAQLEGSGRPAIFSRLGAQQLMMRANQREIGLKYGDYLIDKYPNLPGNYLFRAEVDLGRGDINHALSEYDQFFALIKNSTQRERSAWQPSIANAIWGCIDFGRVNKAKEYFQTYKDLNSREWDYKWNLQDIRKAILIAEFDQLDVTNLKKTNFWNPTLERYSLNLMNEALNIQTSLFSPSDWETAKDYLRAGNLKGAIAEVNHDKNVEPTNYEAQYRYTAGAAEVALALNRPNDAIEAIEQYSKEDSLSSQLSLLLAAALERTQKPRRTIAVADLALAGFVSDRSVGVYDYYHYTNYRLPLMLIKARALFDLGKVEPALKLCNQITELSPDWIAPNLLKLEIMTKQNDRQEQSKLISLISSQLKKVAP
jgi:hypothetical protein